MPLSGNRRYFAMPIEMASPVSIYARFCLSCLVPVLEQLTALLSQLQLILQNFHQSVGQRPNLT